MNKKSLLYEGKAKKIYETDDPNIVIQEFKDSATAFDGKKSGVILNKGHINAKLSSLLFTILAQNGIENQHISFTEPNILEAKRLRMIPLEIVVRNIAAGSLSKRLGYPEGKPLSRPVVEIYYKDDSLGDPLINEMHAYELGVIDKERLDCIKETAIKVNDVLKRFFSDCRLDLVDFKLEFGLQGNKILLADEISPDTCRLWDIDTKERLDKDRFRKDLGKVEEAYIEVLNRAEEQTKKGDHQN